MVEDSILSKDKNFHYEVKVLKKKKKGGGGRRGSQISDGNKCSENIKLGVKYNS